MVNIGGWLSEAWEIISEDLVTHLILGAIVAYGSSLTGGILFGPLMAGYLMIVFAKLKDRSYKPEVGQIGKGFGMFVPAFLVWLVGGIIAGLGVIACVIGVFFTSALVVLALPLVVEGGRAWWPAITESINKTKQNLLPWTGYVVVMALLHGVGGSVTGSLGLIVTMPLMGATLALAYRDNYGLAGAEAPAGPDDPTAPPTPETPEPPSAPTPQ